MALDVRELDNVGWVVLVCCVMLRCVLSSVWLCGLWVRLGPWLAGAPGLAWPWLEVAAYSRRLACRDRSARWGGRGEWVGGRSEARSMTLSFTTIVVVR